MLAAVAGVFFNVSQRALDLAVGGRPELPWYIASVVGMAEQAFTPLVLFIAGLGTRGSIGSLMSLHSAILPASLVMLKSLLLPVVAYGCVLLLGGDYDATDFGFAYGILPVSNAVFAISRRQCDACSAFCTALSFACLFLDQRSEVLRLSVLSLRCSCFS